jgi:type I restriction enzyme S subunit
MSGAQPKLRFREFTGEWEEKPLSSAWRVKGKRNFSNTFGKEHVLSVSGDKGIVNQIEHLGRSYAGAVVDNYHVVETGDIVYTKSPLKANPFGIIKANKGPAGIVSTLYAVYEVCADNDPVFWDRYFELDDRTNGYLMPLVHIGAKNDMKINNERVLIDPVFIPALAEQQKIAAFLGAVDAKLAALAAKQAALGRFKAGLMQKLFSQQLRFTRDGGKAFPDWEEKRLGKLGKFTGGGTPDTNNVSYWDGDIPWISSSDILENDLSGPRITRFINDKALKDSATKIVPANSILIVSRVGVGKLAVSRHDVCTSQDFTSFTPSSDNVLFLGFWMLSNTNALLRLCQGTSIKGLTSDDLKSLVVPIPHPDEQQKIADALSAMDAKIQAVANQLTKLQTFKKGLLQQMFV